MAIELKVPQVGESIAEVQIGHWLRYEGDAVREGEILVEIETDKITVELPAPASGTLGKLLKTDGTAAAVGEVIGYLQKSESVSPQVEVAPVVPVSAAAPPPAPVQISAPTSAPVATGEEQVVPMSPLRRRIAERLVQAQQTAALLTTFNEADMSAVMALRAAQEEAFHRRHQVKLGIMSFFVKAAVDALKRFPQVNAEVRGTNIVFRNRYDIGVAVSTEKGLVVPVLAGAEHMSFAEIETAIADFAARARDGKLKPAELQGGTFTITNGGVFGSLLSTPIVNPPQSGILGLHAIQDRPVARGGAVVVRPMMYLALTYDHCIVDGREAVGFLRRIKEVIEEPARMLIEI